MKKTITILLMLLLSGYHTPAQTSSPSETNTLPVTEETAARNRKRAAAKPRSNIKENLFYGGYINLSLGNYMVIGIEPMVGYKWTNKLSTGVKARYDYIRDKRYAKTYTTSNYGGSIFARYQIKPGFYVQLEPASYNYELFYLGGGSEREWVPFLFAGGGYIQPLSERTWLNVQILFDILQSDKSPYDDWEPFFSIGIGAGF